MSTKSHVSSRSTAVISMIVFLPALIIFALWSTIGMRFSGLSRSEQVDYFLDYFPGWLQNMTVLHVLSIVLCVIAITLASRSFRKKLLWVRVTMLMIVFISIFLILFDIYQLIY
ncbi:MAG: hypothetical protein ABIP35_04360 [Ginsengibacter sp.]